MHNFVRNMSSEFIFLVERFYVYARPTLSARHPELINVWNGHRFVRRTPLFPNNLEDFVGRLIQAVTFHFPPAVFKTSGADEDTKYHGIEIHIIKELTKALNMTVCSHIARLHIFRNNKFFPAAGDPRNVGRRLLGHQRQR